MKRFLTVSAVIFAALGSVCAFSACGEEQIEETIQPYGHLLAASSEGVCEHCGELLYDGSMYFSLSKDKTYYTADIMDTEGDVTVPHFYYNAASRKYLPVTQVVLGGNFVDSVTLSDLISDISHSFSQLKAMAEISISDENTTYSIENDLLILTEQKKVVEYVYAQNEDCNVESIEVPAGIEVIGLRCFADLTTLKSVTIPDSVKSLEGSAFRGCKQLSTIALGEESSLQEIGASAFKGCTALTSFAIPEGVTQLSANVFEDCTYLAQVSIPKNVQKIGVSAFEDCRRLKTVTLAEDSSIKEICSMAFFNCRALTGIALPDTLDRIGNSAFGRCVAMPRLEIPTSVTQVGSFVVGANPKKQTTTVVVKFAEGQAPSTWDKFWNKNANVIYDLPLNDE